jgi:hypothetical protein
MRTRKSARVVLIASVSLLVAAGAFAAPKVVKNPVLGALTLGSGASEAASDIKKLSRYFAAVRQSESATPKCDVLFLYGKLEPDGTFRGTARQLRSIVRESGAAIVVIASDNLADTYVASGKSGAHRGIVLVMTIERKGDVFAAFFQELFSRMQRGEEMLSAWVAIVPQGPVEPAMDTPDTIATAGSDGVIFAYP